jgi:hypothetical protein
MGDISVSNNAYFAMIDTLIGPDESNHKRSFSSDFKKLCSPHIKKDANISAGCALIVFEIYGDQDRSISDFNYQVQISQFLVLLI